MDFTLQCESDFDLQKTLNAKPFFFFLDTKPERVVSVDGVAVKLSFLQKDNKLIVTYNKQLTDEQLDALQKRIEFCLGCTESMDEFYLMTNGDLVLGQQHHRIHGKRIVAAYDDFEAIISLVCSQNASFDEYKGTVRKLIAVVGKGVFPSPSDILARKSSLAKVGLQNKAQQIIMLAELFQKRDGKVTEEHLSKIEGIGEQTIEFFLLHQRRDYSHYALDSLIKRIIRTYYNVDFEKDAETRAFLKRRFGDYSGLAVRYLRKLMSEDMMARQT